MEDGENGVFEVNQSTHELSGFLESNRTSSPRGQPSGAVALPYPDFNEQYDLTCCAPVADNIRNASSGHVQFVEALQEQQRRMHDLLHRFTCVGEAFSQRHYEFEQLALEQDNVVRQALDMSFMRVVPEDCRTQGTEDGGLKDASDSRPAARVSFAGDIQERAEEGTRLACGGCLETVELGEEPKIALGEAIHDCLSDRSARRLSASGAFQANSTISFLSCGSVSTSLEGIQNAVTSTVRSFADMFRKASLQSTDSLAQRQETRRAYGQMLDSSPNPVAQHVVRKFAGMSEAAHRDQLRSEGTLHGRVGLCLRGTAFQSLITVLIVMQALLIGFTTNWAARLAMLEWDGMSALEVEATANLLQMFYYMDIVFSCSFTVELILRLTCDRWLFVFSPEWKWNLLDLFLVVSAAVEYLLVASVVDISFFRLVRICRALRTLRIFRMFRMFGGLRLMVDAIFQSLLPLIWTSIFLGILIFIFAVLFQQAVTNFLHGASEDDRMLVTRLRTFFENIPLTMLTLFMSITGGISWWEVIQLVLEIETPWYGLLFVAYIAVMFIFALNIITGVLVNNVVETAVDQKEMRREHQNKGLREIQALWKLMDPLGQGFLTRSKFGEVLGWQNVRAACDHLNLDPSDLNILYDSLDVDCNRRLEQEEFVVGLMRSHFKSNMVDSGTLLREHRKAEHYTAMVARHTQHQFLHLNEKVDKLSVGQHSLHTLIQENRAANWRCAEKTNPATHGTFLNTRWEFPAPVSSSASEPKPNKAGLLSL